jgi:hypothetical protein
MQELKYLIICFLFASCIQVKQVELFEEASEQKSRANVEGFYAVDILKDNMNSEVWYTENVNCIEVSSSKDVLYAGDGAFHLKWDKVEGGCDWVGMGVGWDGWAAKNLSSILNKAAIQFRVHAENSKITSLPLAMSLEDYAGNAAWLGVHPEFIQYEEGEEWGTVTMPLERFGWDEFGADPANIKQMIIQFEAAGEAYMDEFRIVPYQGLKANSYSARNVDDAEIAVDGIMSEWTSASIAEVDGHHFKLAVSDQYLYVSGSLDNSGQTENKVNSVELAFSLNAEAFPKRTALLMSDQHLKFDLSDSPGVLDMRKDKSRMSQALLVVKRNTNETVFEGRIPFSYFGMGKMRSGEEYAVEWAVNTDQQLRWNSPNRKGFESNPSLWGTLEILNKTQ